LKHKQHLNITVERQKKRQNLQEDRPSNF
jgi:hypothetical protein